MKNVLIIPHSSAKNIVIRSHEIAKSLNEKHQVYYLKWYRRENDALKGKVLEILKNAFQSLKLDVEKNTKLHVIKARKIYYPQFLALAANKNVIGKIIRKYQIDIVINASFYFYPMLKNGKAIYIYDLVDDHIRGHAGNFSSSMSARVKAFSENELTKADYVLTVTNSLGSYIEKNYGISPIWVPNGADIQKFQSVSNKHIKEFRVEYELQDKYVIGYFGNLRDAYTGLEFLLSFFRLAQSKYGHVSLLLAGPMTEKQKGQASNTEGVIYLGHLAPSKMPLLFRSIDLGVLPFSITPFTDNALPIKIIEYGAAQKQVISTDLAGVREAELSYVHFAERDEEEWLKIFAKVMGLSWSDKNAADIKRYDWQNLTEEIESLF